MGFCATEQPTIGESKRVQEQGCLSPPRSVQVPRPCIFDRCSLLDISPRRTLRKGGFKRYIFNRSGCAQNMPKVLHIGPCDSPGGMANVMRILAEHPPEGWEAELLASHVVGSPWAKWVAYRKARKTLIRMLNDPAQRPDVVHLHTAADWSWWRKRRFAHLAHGAGSSVVVHIHSGKFDTWLKSKSKKFKRRLKLELRGKDIQVVVLTEDWIKLLEKDLGNLVSISNPLEPKYKTIIRENTQNHLLLLGRNDPVKGHSFVVEIALRLKSDFPDLVMTMTGVDESAVDWIKASGWVTESEKMRLLSTASVLLLPSEFEGQPMVVIESLASGLPVVADSRLHSLPKEVLFADPDIESWCQILTDALEHPKSIKFDSSEYDLATVRKKWKNLYVSLIDS